MVLVAVLTYLYSALTDGGVDRAEWMVTLNTLLGAFVVWVVPNMSAGIGRYAKAIAAAGSAGLSVLAVAVVGGLTQAELIEVVLAAAAAIGLTAGVKNADYRFKAGVHS
jgi:hypothetical protein